MPLSLAVTDTELPKDCLFKLIVYSTSWSLFFNLNVTLSLLAISIIPVPSDVISFPSTIKYSFDTSLPIFNVYDLVLESKSRS